MKKCKYCDHCKPFSNTNIKLCTKYLDYIEDITKITECNNFTLNTSLKLKFKIVQKTNMFVVQLKGVNINLKKFKTLNDAYEYVLFNTLINNSTIEYDIKTINCAERMPEYYKDVLGFTDDNEVIFCHLALYSGYESFCYEMGEKEITENIVKWVYLK